MLEKTAFGLILSLLQPIKKKASHYIAQSHCNSNVNHTAYKVFNKKKRGQNPFQPGSTFILCLYMAPCSNTPVSKYHVISHH